MLAHLVWNVDPDLFAAGPVRLRWYGLLFALAFVLGDRVMRRIYRSEGRGTDIDSLVIHVLVGTVVGARLLHCFVYEPERYLADPVAILKVWEGGLASHGGAAGVALAAWIYSRRHPDQPFLWLLDRAALPAALASGFIRIGNLFNSEILGKPSDLPWAVVFARVDDVPRHPAMVYEALVYFAVFAALVVLLRRRGADTPRGLLVGTLLVAIFTSRFLLEFVKEPQTAAESGMALDLGQILSVPAVLAGVALIVRARRPAPPA